MRLQAAIEGKLNEVLRDEARVAERAVSNAIRKATDGLKQDLRQQVVSAGFGNRLSKSWRSKLYPAGAASIEAAGLVFSKAPVIIRAFDEGAVIRSKNGVWLAIPSPAAPKKGVGGKRINPSNFPEHRFGRLRFVYRPRVSLLVVDNARASFSRKTGQLRGFRKASDSALRTGRGLTTVVMFFLVPQVRLPKKLDIDRQANRWRGRIPALLNREWDLLDGKQT